MLLQIALDKPEHLALLPQIRHIADIVEIGTPLLKRFGIGTITTARELCPDTPVLADSKTLDGGQLEAEMVFGAGAAFMTVLSSTTSATALSHLAFLLLITYLMVGLRFNRFNGLGSR